MWLFPTKLLSKPHWNLIHCELLQPGTSSIQTREVTPFSGSAQLRTQCFPLFFLKIDYNLSPSSDSQPLYELLRETKPRKRETQELIR